MADAGAGEKLKVFISYSRKDSAAFVDDLVVGLEDRGFAPILDRHDIKPGEPWEARLGGLIEQSDTVVFVVSPEAVKSERCGWEIDKTLALSKRLLPVIHKSLPDAEIPPKLSERQFIRFDTAPGVMRPLRELADALRIDLQWIREHTRLGELATRWDGRGRPESLLLRGDEIDAAKTWMAARNAAAPEITDAQRAFVRASDDAEAARHGKERAQLKATARLQRRIAWLLGGVAVLVLAMVGYVTWESYDVARREINVFTARAAEALHDEQFDRAMRYALRTYPARGSLPWTTPFSTELEATLAGGALSARLRQLLKGHSRAVQSAEFSGDGKRVVTAAEDNTARIWDVDSGKEIAVLKGLADAPVRRAGFSGDGKRVVTAAEDNTARIWDAERGEEIAVLKGHADSLLDAAFSGDGKRVVTASFDKTARIWNAESGTEIIALTGHTDRVWGARFSDDGKRVATAGDDQTVRVWNAESGTEIVVVKSPISVQFVAFSGDGKRVVTPDANTARLWDTDSGKEIVILKGHTAAVSRAAFSADGKRLVTTSFEDSTARIWDADSGKEIAVLKGSTAAVVTAAFSADGKRVVTGGDKTARIWDVDSGKEMVVLKGHTADVSAAAFSADGKQVVTASFDHTARIWDAESGKEIVVPIGPVSSNTILGAAFSGDGKRVVTVSGRDRTARIWDTESGGEVAVLKHGRDVLANAGFSGDGRQVVTISSDTVHIWDAENGKEIAVLDDASAFGAALSGDGKRVVTGGVGNSGRIYDVESAKAIAVLVGHHDMGFAVAFSRDGKRVVTGYGDNTARVWDAESHKEIAFLEGHERLVWNAAFSADGKQVVTAGTDGTARIWDAESGRAIAVLKHPAHVLSAAFSADGKRVVTSADTARIWDAESGGMIAVLKGHAGRVAAAAFSGDGKRVLTASTDNTIRIWDISWATQRGDALREGVCHEKLTGAAQEFTNSELQDDPILRGIDKNDPVARNPCLNRGPLSLDYWTRLPGQLWHSVHRLVGVN